VLFSIKTTLGRVLRTIKKIIWKIWRGTVSLSRERGGRQSRCDRGSLRWGPSVPLRVQLAASIVEASESVKRICCREEWRKRGAMAEATLTCLPNRAKREQEMSPPLIRARPAIVACGPRVQCFSGQATVILFPDPQASCE
jgi:hypothetical protein